MGMQVEWLRVRGSDRAPVAMKLRERLLPGVDP